MRNLVALLLTSLSIGCGNKQVNTNMEVSDVTDSKYYLADSLYRHIAYMGVLDSRLFSADDFTSVDEPFKEKFINNIQPSPVLKFSNIYPQYGCRYIAKQKPVGNASLIVVDLSADDYGSLMLLVIDSNSNVVSWKELSGGLCGGPDEYEDRLEDCPTSYSIFESPSAIRRTQTRRIYPITNSAPNIKNYFIDSTTYRYNIKDDGSIITTLLDSTRFAVN